MIVITRSIKQVKQNAQDWPAEYTVNFLEAGLVSYEDVGAGIAMLRKETILKLLPTFVGKPVVIDHIDVTPADFKQHAVGYITRTWFDDYSGWAYCSFILTDDKAKEKVAKGYSVSCAYDVISTGKGGDWHAIKYDEEITDGSGTHLALVTSPRYEDCKIQDCRMLVNSKKAIIKEGEGEGKKNSLGLSLHGQAVEGKYDSIEELLKANGYKSRKELEDAGYEVFEMGKKENAKMTTKSIYSLEPGESVVISKDDKEYPSIRRLDPDKYTTEPKDDYSVIVTRKNSVIVTVVNADKEECPGCLGTGKDSRGKPCSDCGGKGHRNKKENNQKEDADMIQLYKKANDKAGAEVDPKDPTKQKWNAENLFVKVENEMIPLSELAKYASKANEFEAAQTVENDVEINGSVHNVADLITNYTAKKNAEEEEKKKEEMAKKNAEDEEKKKKEEVKENETDEEKKKREEGEKKNAEEEKKKEDNKNKEDQEKEEETIKKNAKAKEEEEAKKKNTQHFVTLNNAREKGGGDSTVVIDTLHNRIDRGKSRYGTATATL